MTKEELDAVKGIVNLAIENTDTINKVWLPIAALTISALTFTVSVIALVVNRRTQRAVAQLQTTTQLQIADLQRATQERVASESLEHQRQALRQQLAAQELASRRIANNNIATKRQTWIDEIRKDMASYLAIWTDLASRWNAFLRRHPSIDNYDAEQKADFQKELQSILGEIALSRRQVDEFHARIVLRLNPAKAEHVELERLMIQLRDNFYLAEPMAPETFEKQSIEFGKTRVQIIRVQRSILKIEWERVKQETYVNPMDALGATEAATQAPIAP